MRMFGLTREELTLLRRLSTPRKIQNFLETLRANDGNDTCRSPREVLRVGWAHCIEGAMLAALALRIHSHPPRVVDLASTPDDLDHVIAVFQQHGQWGAISKTNHATLRYREPIYRSIRELVMSYFHEYTTDDGKKTLRSYTQPVDLSRFDNDGWMTSSDDVWKIPCALADTPHIPLLSRSQIATLRRADPIEQKAGKLRQWHAGQKNAQRAIRQ